MNTSLFLRMMAIVAVLVGLWLGFSARAMEHDARVSEYSSAIRADATGGIMDTSEASDLEGEAATRKLLSWALGLGGVVVFFGALIAAPERDTRSRIRCPDCMEEIIAGAKVCKHCGRTFAQT